MAWFDRKNCTANQEIGQQDVKYMMDVFELEDVWRRRNPEKIGFTWEGRRKQSRIDYWLIPKAVDNQVEAVYIKTAPFSDHSAIFLSLRTSHIDRGKGMWKMNASIVTSDIFKSAFQKRWSELRENKHKYVNIQTWWDIVKRNIEYLALNIWVYLHQNENARCKELEGKLDFLKESSDMEQKSRLTVINEIKKELHDIYKKRGTGDKIRSRVKWWEEGEKSTKYFHSLEKSRGKDKLWHEIKDKNGELMHETCKIQQCQVEFYRELFTSEGMQNLRVENDILSKLTNRLDNTSKQELEKDIGSNDSFEKTEKQ